MDPFLGEIRAVPYTFPPNGWADCNGQLLPIQQNTALFSLLGTFYGGDGKSTFALPDLRDRVAISQGQGPGLTEYLLGETDGVSNETLLVSQIPQHTHMTTSSSLTAGSADPTNAVYARPAIAARLQNLYHSSSGSEENPGAVSPNGGNQPHNNMQPYLGMRYVIALNGIFPARS